MMYIANYTLFVTHLNLEIILKHPGKREKEKYSWKIKH